MFASTNHTLLGNGIANMVYNLQNNAKISNLA